MVAAGPADVDVSEARPCVGHGQQVDGVEQHQVGIESAVAAHWCLRDGHVARIHRPQDTRKAHDVLKVTHGVESVLVAGPLDQVAQVVNLDTNKSTLIFSILTLNRAGVLKICQNFEQFGRF